MKSRTACLQSPETTSRKQARPRTPESCRPRLEGTKERKALLGRRRAAPLGLSVDVDQGRYLNAGPSRVNGQVDDESRTRKGVAKTSRASAGPLPDDHLSASDVRQRAVASAAVNLLRGIGVKCLGLVGLLVLARMLSPTDFGVVAFGATLVTFANFLADGGIGNALIRRVEPPERADLKALLGFQLGFSTVLAIGIGLAMPFRSGRWVR